ncbi:putative mediator of rna polymerase ii transcription subunit, partial [Botrytis fragariae]
LVPVYHNQTKSFLSIHHTIVPTHRIRRHHTFIFHSAYSTAKGSAKHPHISRFPRAPSNTIPCFTGTSCATQHTQRENKMTTINSPPEDIKMEDGTRVTPSVSGENEEPKFGGFTRFEIELEFINAISSPYYLMHLASLSSGTLLSSPPFIAYLKYLQYFTQPPYLKFLSYPGPSLKHLELLQNENFRRDCLSIDIISMLASEDMAAVERWQKE